MRLKFVICKVLEKEASLCASRSANLIDLVIMPQGLHTEPHKLQAEIQKELDQTTDRQGNAYDAMILGYGLCSNGIDGLIARMPVVIPRAHDCITLLIGSIQKYKEYFDSHKGVYWYSPGWIETGLQPGKDRDEKLYQEYKQKYGQENAEYLMQIEKEWAKRYSWAAYIDWNFENSEKDKEFTKKSAEYLNWSYDELKGDDSLIQKLVDGDWDPKLFCCAKPGQKFIADLTDEGLIHAE